MASNGNGNALNVSVLGAAKEMYIKQLKIVLTPLIHEGIVSLWEDAQKKEDEQGGYSYLRQFQIFLKDIPNWNQTILEEESRRILGKIDFLMELVTAIFVSHVKILASVRLGGHNRNIRIKVPNAEVFIHTVYTNAAEMIYYNPNVFQHHTDRDSYERIRDLIGKSIDETIDSMIPIESVLKEYLSNVFSGHITTPPAVPAPPEESFDRMLSGNQMGLMDDDEESPANPTFGTGNDPFIDPFPSTESSIGDKLESIDPFGGSDDFGSSSDPFGDDKPSSDPFGGSSSADPFGDEPSSDPFGSDDKPSSDPFGSSSDDSPDFRDDTSDPFGSDDKPNDKPADDPFGSSSPTDPFESSDKPADDPFESSDKPADDPFGSSSADTDPFGSSSADTDPFGSSSADADPFGSSSADADPFGSSSGDADPFGSSSADPFSSGSGDVDPFSSNPDDIKVI